MEQLRYYQDEIGNIYEVKTDLEKKIILDIVKKQDEIDKQKEVLDKIKEYIKNNLLYEEEYDYDYEENIYLSGVNDTKAKEDINKLLEELK